MFHVYDKYGNKTSGVGWECLKVQKKSKDEKSQAEGKIFERRVCFMSTLQMEFMETIEGLSDDTMRMLLEVVRQVVLPLDHQEKVSVSSEQQGKLRRLGSLRGQKLISEGYDIDESNDEIAKMFGVE